MLAAATTDLVNTVLGLGVPLLLIVLGLVVGKLSEGAHLRSLARRESDLGDMIVADVRAYLGGAVGSKRSALVTAEVVIANDYLKSFFASLRKIVGGELRSYQSLMSRARREVLVKLLTKARGLGHNALCNVRYETADIGGMVSKGGAATVAVTASATAYTTPGPAGTS